MNPKISVIVTAHDREKYLMEALYSILNQTLDKNLYQVIVTKNFTNQNIDNFIEKCGFLNLICSGSLANKISFSINYCEGEIVTFLEDDDKYSNNRLKKIIDAFEKFPCITFFRNSMVEMNEIGQISTRTHHPQINKKILLECSEIKSKLPYLISKNIDFNNGCIAIRRDVLMNHLNIYNNSTKASSLFTDSLYFLFSLNAGGSIFVDPEILTYVRRHDSASLKLTGEISKRIEFYYKSTKNFLDVMKIVQQTPNLTLLARRYILLKTVRAELEEKIILHSNRTELLYSLKNYIIHTKKLYGKYNLLLLISALISFGFKNIGPKFLYQVLNF